MIFFVHHLHGVTMMNNVFVKLQDMPTTVRGLVAETPEGDHVMFLNAKLSSEALRETYRHEMRHIKSGDMDNAEDATTIELENH